MTSICIIGAGVMGCTSAYMLHKAGFDVTLVDREKEAGLKASNSNAAQLGFSSIYPFASIEDVLSHAGHLLFSNPLTDDVYVKRDFSMQALRFFAALGYYSLPSRYKKQASKLHDMVEESCLVLNTFMSENPDIDFDYKTSGKIYVYGTEERFKNALKNIKGHKPEVLLADDLMKYAPCLSYRDNTPYGGLLHKGDYIGNSGKLCREIVAQLEKKGRFQLLSQTKVSSLEVDNTKSIMAVNTDQGPLSFDAYIVTAGAWSSKILTPLGIKMPFYPVKGYTLTLKSDFKTDTCISDTDYGFAYAPLGDDLRISGMMDFEGWDDSINPDRAALLKARVKKAYPDLDIQDAELRCGLRPVHASSLPIIGRRKYKNLYLNLGQGMWGWTLSFASAKYLSDQVVLDYA